MVGEFCIGEWSISDVPITAAGQAQIIGIAAVIGQPRIIAVSDRSVRVAAVANREIGVAAMVGSET